MNKPNLNPEAADNGINYIQNCRYSGLINAYINLALGENISYETTCDFYRIINEIKSENKNAYLVAKCVFEDIISKKIVDGYHKELDSKLEELFKE